MLSGHHLWTELELKCQGSTAERHHFVSSFVVSLGAVWPVITKEASDAELS